LEWRKQERKRKGGKERREGTSETEGERKIAKSGDEP
jgi:hypothetical protein